MFSHQHSPGNMGDRGQQRAGSTHYSFSDSLFDQSFVLGGGWLAGLLTTHALRAAPKHKYDSGLGGERQVGDAGCFQWWVAGLEL